MPDDRYILSPFKERKSKRSCAEVLLMGIGLAAMFVGWIWIAAWLLSMEG